MVVLPRKHEQAPKSREMITPLSPLTIALVFGTLPLPILFSSLNNQGLFLHKLN